jgi:hypothetical protein
MSPPPAVRADRSALALPRAGADASSLPALPQREVDSYSLAGAPSTVSPPEGNAEKAGN